MQDPAQLEGVALGCAIGPHSSAPVAARALIRRRHRAITASIVPWPAEAEFDGTQPVQVHEAPGRAQSELEHGQRAGSRLAKPSAWG